MRIIVFIFGLLCSICSCASPTVISLKSLSGCYLEKTFSKDETINNSNFIKTNNILTISPESEVSATFNLSVVGANLHECSAYGKLDLIFLSDDVTILKFHPSEDQSSETTTNLDCQLQVIATTKRISLVDLSPDASRGCHAMFYCGARAGLNGHNFDRKSKVEAHDNSCNP